MPLPELTWNESCLGWFCDITSPQGPENAKKAEKALMDNLWWRYFWQRYNPLTPADKKIEYIFGWLPFGTYSNADMGGGSASITWEGGGNGRTAFGDDHPTEGAYTFAHEVGHLLGQRHTCSTACWPKLKQPALYWPWADENSFIQEYGLDGYGFGWLISSASALKTPQSSNDYMSYCGPFWTSPWTYTRIYSDKLKLEPAAATAQFLLDEQPYFVANGLVYTDDIATFDPIWVVTSTTTAENPPVGTSYCLEAQDLSERADV